MLRMIDQWAAHKSYWTAAALRINGIQVAALKVTEGVHDENPYYQWQLQQARLAGCAVIHYHVAHPEANGAHEETDWFFSKVRAASGDLIMLDAPPHTFGVVPASAASAWAAQWSAAVEDRYKVKPVVYASGSTIADGALESVRGKNPLCYDYAGASPQHPPAPPMPWLVSFLWHTVNHQWAPPEGTDVGVAYFDSRQQLADLAVPPRTFDLTVVLVHDSGADTKNASFKVSWV